jgi:hypothetical protein
MMANNRMLTAAAPITDRAAASQQRLLNPCSVANDDHHDHHEINTSHNLDRQRQNDFMEVGAAESTNENSVCNQKAPAGITSVHGAALQTASLSVELVKAVKEEVCVVVPFYSYDHN